MLLSKKRTTKALIRLRGCAGWSAPVLFANPRKQGFSRLGPNGCWHFNIYEKEIFRAQLNWAWKKHYNLGTSSLPKGDDCKTIKDTKNYTTKQGPNISPPPPPTMEAIQGINNNEHRASGPGFKLIFRENLRPRFRKFKIQKEHR